MDALFAKSAQNLCQRWLLSTTLAITFSNGYTYAYGKSNPFYVRLVQSGQSLAPFDAHPTAPTPPPTPVPTLSEWALLAFAALIVAVGLAGRRFRR